MHKADGGYVVSSGPPPVMENYHQIQNSRSCRRHQVVILDGTHCATSNCRCSLPKLSDVIQEHDEKRALVGTDSEDEYPPDCADDETDPNNSEVRLAFEESVAAADPFQVFPGGTPSKPEDVEHDTIAAPLDSYDIDRAKLALHGAGGNSCGCETKTRPSRMRSLHCSLGIE